MFTWKEVEDVSHPLNALILASQLDQGINGKKRDFYDKTIIEFVRLHPYLINKELKEAIAKWVECISERKGYSASDVDYLTKKEKNAQELIIKAARSVYYSYDQNIRSVSV